MFKKILKLLNNVKMTHSYVENWFDVYYYYLNIKSKIKIKYKNNHEYEFDHSKSDSLWVHNLIMELIKRGCSFDQDKVIINDELVMKIDPRDLSIYIMLLQTFFEHDYVDLYVKNKIVGDVGASIGDTAIYFARKGAKKVYAYEPLKEQYELLVENVRLNGFEDVIIPINCAVQEKPGNVFINPINSWSGGSKTSLKEEGQGYWVKAIPLHSDIESLKMDCEGCEYDILKNMRIEETNIDEMIMEYHSNLEKLIGIFEKQHISYKLLKQGPSRGLIYIKLK